MESNKTLIGGIPAVIWGKPSDKVYIHVHGKMSRKEFAENFAIIAERKGWQTISFDLPEHGERTDKTYRCDVWNGMRDLNTIADYAYENWQRVAVCGCSLGAYFALNTYADRPLAKCLFQSPIVDMEWLVRHMMLWSNVTEEQLEREKEIDTPIDLLRWDYFSYIITHPVEKWTVPTSILYGALDDLQPIESLRAFEERFGAALTVSDRSKHPFMEPEDGPIVHAWLEENI